MYIGVPFGAILVVILAVILTVAFFSKSSKRGLAIAIGLIFVFAVLLWGSYARVASVESSDSSSWSQYPRLTEATDSEIVKFRSISNEEMWDQLTKEKIVLDVEKSLNEDSKDKKPKQITVEVPKRPEWVDQEPKKFGSVYRAVVSSDPFSTIEECHEQLEQKVMEVVVDRVMEISDIDQPIAASSLGIGLDYVFREICTKSFIETRASELFDAKKVYVQLEFTQKVDDHLKEKAKSYLRDQKEQLRNQRLQGIALIALLVVSLLAAIYTALKFDTWTRGYYTKQLVAGTIVLMLLLASIVTLVS